jgi:hypothetical protein
MTQDNVPVKYTLGIWKSLPVYPTKLDVLYEIYAFMFKSGKTEFSEQTLNSLWLDAKGVGNWKGTKYEHFFIELRKDSTIKEIKKVGDKSWLVIDPEKNPFI